jgi:hypothetical protein
MMSAPPQALPASSHLTWRNHLDHFLARWGWRRGEHRLQPGLYALGDPSPDSAVFVTANYTLSFDALRAALQSLDGYVLVLDTHGVNVWCAAGEGTFGTAELVRRIAQVRLAEVVRHRTLILPQLGAAGVSAHEVKKRSGFRVVYGPIRAADLPAYLQTHQATPAMRRVRFSLGDRMVLIPVELVGVLLPLLVAAVILRFLGGWFAVGAAAAAVLAGVVLFPILLPWLPTREFSTKGSILGALVALPFALATLLSAPAGPGWRQAMGALGCLLAMVPTTAYLALNFTGATPLTSRTGVKREIYRYIRPMAVLFGLGALLTLASAVLSWVGAG